MAPANGQDAGAKELFLGSARDLVPIPAGQAPGAPASGTGVNPGLKYRLTQKLATGEEIDVDPETAFRSGQGVRFTFESNVDGFLYVIQEGSSGRWTLLFPHPDVNGGSHAVGRRRQVSVPENGWFMFDETPGTERLFVFLSREPGSQLPGLNQPLSALQAISPSIVDALGQTIRPRDLVFEKDKAPPGAKTGQATYVVNRDELAKAVATTIQLVHAK
jgi:hypothetical protein